MIVTLLTDFGDLDGFVGATRGPSPSPRPAIASRLHLTALSLSLLLGACGEPLSTGQVQGRLLVPDCAEGKPRRYECDPSGDPGSCAAFSLDPDFFSLELSEERAVIRLQRGGRPFGEVDGFLLEIRDIRALRGQLQRPLLLGPEENIRGALGLFEACPDSTQNFTLRGEVRFERFGLSRGDRVKGSLLWIEVRDGRDASQALGQLRGDFDFEILRGPPFETFPGAGAR
ncbi:hypothetical protein KKF91_04335 [Myxococcota bacterium]|nr:hypothetical protein [Myxococcota bacterium]MBU1429774.1 hypothetical protein [Myxococcota bacterium]MBU1897605.1 hypothetical protein [Myxococcota bacterium]